MKVHHIGYAVINMVDALEQFKKLGFEEGAIIYDESRNINICFIKNGENCVELIEIYDKNKKAPIDFVLKKNGSFPYHICYETEDIYKKIDEMKSDGWCLVDDVAPAIAIKNKKVAFLFNSKIGLVELLQTV